ncbi:MAG: uroporphyrinogen-III synthase, partial [Verrucomicrobiia bacterium]
TSSLDVQSLAASRGTKIFLMGVERLGPILGDLMRGGLSSSTPAAIVNWASTNRQRTLVSTVGKLAEDAAEAGFSPPCITVVGDVVRLREKLAWFEKRPLFGKKIVVTRSRKQAGTLADSLTKLGAFVEEIPTIRTEPPTDLRAFGEAVAHAHSYDWLVFTSPNAVEAFFEMFFKIYKDAREIGAVRIAAVGPATAAKIASYRFAVDLQPDEYVAEGILRSFDELGSIENQTFLLPLGASARDVLQKAFLSKGAIVDVVTAYRTVPETGDPTGALARFAENGADVITFTSSSTVTNFLALGAALPPSTCLASIGPITSKTLRDHGLEPTLEAEQHDIPGLVAAIKAYFCPSNL